MKFVMKGKITWSSQISNEWNIKIVMRDFVPDKVRSIENFTKNYRLRGLDTGEIRWLTEDPKLYTVNPDGSYDSYVNMSFAIN